MKRILILLIIVLASSCASHNSFNTFYKNNQEDSNFSFGLNSSLIASFLPYDEMEEIKPLLNKAKHVRILVFSENAEEKTENFQRFISRSKFEEVVKLKGNNDQFAFFALEKRSQIKEIVLEIGTEDKLVLLGLKTNLSREDLEKILQ